MKLYGIANCDTVKRARAWLNEQGLAHDFHDFKKTGAPQEKLAAWLAAVGWQTLLNRKGTTWRKLAQAEREAVVDAASAQALMALHTSAIKRPLVEWPDGCISVGFEPALWAEMAKTAQLANRAKTAKSVP